MPCCLDDLLVVTTSRADFPVVLARLRRPPLLQISRVEQKGCLVVLPLHVDFFYSSYKALLLFSIGLASASSAL